MYVGVSADRVEGGAAGRDNNYVDINDGTDGNDVGAKHLP